MQSILIPAGAKKTLQVLSIDQDTEIQVTLGDHASLELVCIEAASQDRKIHVRQQCTLGAHAALHIHNISLGKGEATHELVSHIQGEGSTSNIDWVFYSRNTEQKIFSARNVFDAPNGRGEMTIHGVAEDEASASFNGCIEITENGRGTDTYLTETTLMLDPTAKVDAIPGLEIKTNDVKASHSATVSKVSEEDLFYFASRGVTEKEARRMYVEGFLGALIQSIPDAQIRQMAQKEIMKKYENVAA